MIVDRCKIYILTEVSVLISTFLFPVLDYVAWKGRFCAFDYTSFERFMTYMFAQVMNREPHVPDPWDTKITIDAMGKSVQLWNLMLLQQDKNSVHLRLPYKIKRNQDNQNGHCYKNVKCKNKWFLLNN